LTIGPYRVSVHRTDNDRPIDSGGLPHARVGVVPVGATLLDFEPIREGFARRDHRKADPWHAVHLIRQDDAMPMDGGGFLQTIFHPDSDRIALAPTQGGRR